MNPASRPRAAAAAPGSVPALWAGSGGRPYVVLLAAVACISFGSILVRVAQAPALVVAAGRIGLAAAVLAPFAWSERRQVGLTRAQWLSLAASGLALGAHFGTWIASLSYTSVAASVLLVNTTPLFSLALSTVWLGEPPGRRALQATAVALAGAATLAYGDWRGGASNPLWGDFLAMAGAATLAVHHVLGRGLRAVVSLRVYVWAVWSVAALALSAAVWLSGARLTGYPVRTWWAIAGLALVPTLAGHGLVNVALRALPAPAVGLFLLAEPLGATLLAWALLGEQPGGWTLTGGTLVLAALIWLVRPER